VQVSAPFGAKLASVTPDPEKTTDDIIISAFTPREVCFFQHAKGVAINHSL